MVGVLYFLFPMASYQGRTRFEGCGLTFFAFHNNCFPLNCELWILYHFNLNLVGSLGSMLFLSKTSCDKVSTSKHQLQTQRIIESKNLVYPPNWNLKPLFPQQVHCKMPRHESWPWTLRHTWWRCYWWFGADSTILKVHRSHIGHISRIQELISHVLSCSFQYGTGNHLFTWLCIFYPHHSWQVWVRHWRLQVALCPLNSIDISQIQSVVCHGTSWRVCSATSPLVPIYLRCCLTLSQVQKHHFKHQVSDIKWEKKRRKSGFLIAMLACCIWTQPTRTTTGFSRDKKQDKWHWREEIL